MSAVYSLQRSNPLLQRERAALLNAVEQRREGWEPGPEAPYYLWCLDRDVSAASESVWRAYLAELAD